MSHNEDPNDPDFEELGIPEGYPEDEYWDIVKKTIKRVFKKEGLDGEVDTLSKDVRKVGKNKSADEKYRFYQTEPYNVAADIAQKSGAGTEEQWREYLRIKKESGFGVSSNDDIPGDLLSPFRRPKTSQDQLLPFSDG